MITIRARNVSEAWTIFHTFIKDDNLVREVAPRGKRTREFLQPVATTYRCPEECVLLDPVRDCNPFFHLYEALWILCGYNDVARVKYYSAQISAYSDDATTFHGAYGHRLRHHFGTRVSNTRIDQLRAVVELLRNDPDSRRGVLQLYDASTDTGKTGDGKDIPCNTMAYVKIREGRVNITVCNRSNDAVWGCYGANAVQFSILLQYLAAQLGRDVGTYTQISDSLHVYLDGKEGDVWNRCAAKPPSLYGSFEPVVHYMPLVRDPLTFDECIAQLLHDPSGRPDHGTANDYWAEPFLAEVVLPMLRAYEVWKDHSREAAREELQVSWARAARKYGKPEAWLEAGLRWMDRRIADKGAANAGQR